MFLWESSNIIHVKCFAKPDHIKCYLMLLIVVLINPQNDTNSFHSNGNHTALLPQRNGSKNPLVYSQWNFQEGKFKLNMGQMVWGCSPS